MSQSIDTDVSHYTIPDLLTILDIKNDDVTEKGVTEKTRVYIDKFTKEKNPVMITFFTDIENRLLDYVDEIQGDTNGITSETQSDEWFQKNSLSQKNNPTQDNKITDRHQKINVFNDSLHLPMKQEQLGIANTVSVPVAQDILNPTLKNTINRMINLDSQFRQTSAGSTDISTDYTLDLSEPLLNVLSLKLHAFMIPYTWYTIDVMYGNNCMWITFFDGPSITITITPGNYTPSTFQDEVRDAFTTNGFKFPDSSGNIYPISINTANALITLNLFGGTYGNSITGVLHTIDETTVVTFFDPTRALSCFNNVSCNRVTSVNQTLGWIMGFRVIHYTVQQEGNTAAGIMDLYGPKYLIIVLDDFNQNHINNGLVGITELSSSLKLPRYYSPDLLYTCNKAQPLGTNLDTLNADLANDPNAGNLIIDKMNITYKSIPQLIPNAPRRLTQSQIYSINEIMKNNGKSTSLRGAAPTVPNTFAIIPIKHVGMKLGDVYVESNGSLQDNKRVYFGPVNIERMRIKLLDDKGNVLNLNGGDWTITLLSENLYQY